MTARTHDQIPEQALAWHLDGGVTLATVMQTWGSAPRPVGSQLAISSRGEIAGSVSGGCVEGAVVEESLAAMAEGLPRTIEFGVSDDNAFAVGLACGGRIEILIEPVDGNRGLTSRQLSQLVELRARRVPVATAINLSTWQCRLVQDGCGELFDLFSHRFTSDRSGMEQDWFVTIHNPPLRLIVVGGVHIGQPLIEFARLVGYDPMLIDPRQAFASEARFPGERIVHDWPDEAIEAEAPDYRTAIVTLSHDPKIDDPALLAAFATDAFYIGCLGSTRTHRKRVLRLRDAGSTHQDLARLHAPVGLDIGAESPAEIAVAIVAQMTSTLRGRGLKA